MKKLIKLLTITSLLILTVNTLSAQKTTTNSAGSSKPTLKAPIIGKGKPFKDHIALRWNIGTHLLFNNLIQGGVLIDRLIINKNNKAEGNWQRITTDTVRALPLQAFNTPDLKNDTAKMIVAQVLYGHSDLPKDISLIQQIKLQDVEKQNKHLVASLYADISPGAAKAAGLGYDDKLVPDTSKQYVYRIYPAKQMPGLGTIDTGYVYVAGHDVMVKEVYDGLKATGSDSHIAIRWDKKSAPFSGYYVDRSEDRVHFKRLGTSIYLPQTDSINGVEYNAYVDSVQNYKRYYYRVTGVNAFGERFTYTDLAAGMGIDQTPPTAPVLKFTRNKDHVTFNWNAITEKDVKGYVLLRGKGNNASDTLASKQIFTPTTTKFDYDLPPKFNAAYYRLLVADTAGNVAFSNPVYIFNPDTVPPKAPIGLTGTIDSKGNVTLKWASDKTDEVIRGYKVFAGNSINGSYANVSNIMPDTTYTFNTTLKTLTKHLYVKVTAIDASFNNSSFSVPLVLNRPDTIPPPKPILLSYDNTNAGIKLTWAADHSNDFSHFIIYRRVAGDTSWINLKQTRALSLVDSTIALGKAYEYTLRSYDSTGLASPYAFPLYIKTSAANKPLNMALTGNYDSGKKTVTVKWTKPALPVKFYILYKDLGKGLTKYKSIPATEESFTEEGSTPVSNQYGLKVVYANSGESELIVLK